MTAPVTTQNAVDLFEIIKESPYPSDGYGLWGTVKILAHFRTALYARLPVRLLQQRHVQVAAGAPRLQNRAAAHRRRLYDRSGDDAERRRPVRDY